MTTTILFKAKVNNDFSFLSNFYPHVKNFDSSRPQPANKNFLFELEGEKFHSVEQYYQYCKFMVVDPWYATHHILTAPTALDVKKRSGKGFYVNYTHSTNSTPRLITKASINVKFDRAKDEFFNEQALTEMRTGLRAKFTQNPELKAALIATGSRKLSEIGRMKRDYWAHTGQDMLGKLLMELRDSFIADE